MTNALVSHQIQMFSLPHYILGTVENATAKILFILSPSLSLILFVSISKLRLFLNHAVDTTNVSQIQLKMIRPKACSTHYRVERLPKTKEIHTRINVPTLCILRPIINFRIIFQNAFTNSSHHLNGLFSISRFPIFSTPLYKIWNR